MTLAGDPKIDFRDTEIAFSYKSDKELKFTYQLFRWMNSAAFVKIGSFFGNIAAKLPFHLADPIIKETIFKQFVGGTSLLECQRLIDKLYTKQTLTILDYGVEAKENDEDFQKTLEENIRCIEFAYSNSNVPAISIKLTAYIPFKVLEKMQASESLNAFDKHCIEKLEERFTALCTKAHDLGVSIFVDAEESWIQNPLDELVDRYMAIYNKEKPIIYNTYQMYRAGKLNDLKMSFEKAKAGNYLLGAKIVRGAYMVKERKRALNLKIPDPIQENKILTDLQYNDAVRFCVQHYEHISVCNSSHNWESNLLQAELMQENQIPVDHPHLNFCQLFGMSDNITFNLAAKGYCVAKYVPYGPVKDVIPYLTRRAQENTSMTGDMSRELKMLNDEMKRRGLIH